MRTKLFNLAVIVKIIAIFRSIDNTYFFSFVDQFDEISNCSAEIYF